MEPALQFESRLFQYSRGNHVKWIWAFKMSVWPGFSLLLCFKGEIFAHMYLCKDRDDIPGEYLQNRDVCGKLEWASWAVLHPTSDWAGPGKPWHCAGGWVGFELCLGIVDRILQAVPALACSSSLTPDNKFLVPCVAENDLLFSVNQTIASLSRRGLSVLPHRGN